MVILIPRNLIQLSKCTSLCTLSPNIWFVRITSLEMLVSINIVVLALHSKQPFVLGLFVADKITAIQP